MVYWAKHQCIVCHSERLNQLCRTFALILINHIHQQRFRPIPAAKGKAQPNRKENGQQHQT